MLSFEETARLGEAIFVFGFPLGGLLSSSGSFTSGNVNSLEGMGDDPRMLQVSAPVQPGNSGGPLLNAQGNLIGVVTSKADAIAIASITKDISQNINFAVKAGVAAAFLRSAGLDPVVPGPSEAMDAAEIAQRAKAVSVGVICHTLPDAHAQTRRVAEHVPTAANEGEGYRVSPDASGGFLNMRSGPGQGHAIVVAIPAGAGGIRKGQCRAGDDGKSRHPWCRVEWQRYSGWASSCCMIAE